MTLDDVSPPGFPPDHPAWRLIHAYYLDAVAGQSSAATREALAEEIGDTLDGFIQACGEQVIIISAFWPPNGLTYRIAVRVSDGMAPMADVHASLLGLDTPEHEADELAWAMRRRDADPPPA